MPTYKILPKINAMIIENHTDKQVIHPNNLRKKTIIKLSELDLFEKK
jgi:hypothetical protein